MSKEKGIPLDGLATAISREMRAYSDEVADGIKLEAIKAAKQCVSEIKEASPTLTKAYKKGWGSKVVWVSRFGNRVVVRNRTDYQLTHLLEHGFTGRSGKRVEGEPHIRPAEERIVRQFLERIKEVARGDG